MRIRLGIGDFSRMTHLSVKALRHYHDVGLLTPARSTRCPAMGISPARSSATIEITAHPTR